MHLADEDTTIIPLVNRHLRGETLSDPIDTIPLSADQVRQLSNGSKQSPSKRVTFAEIGMDSTTDDSFDFERFLNRPNTPSQARPNSMNPPKITSRKEAPLSYDNLKEHSNTSLSGDISNDGNSVFESQSVDGNGNAENDFGASLIQPETADGLSAARITSGDWARPHISSEEYPECLAPTDLPSGRTNPIPSDSKSERYNDQPGLQVTPRDRETSDFSTPAVSDVVCTACSMVFKGNQQDATANLRRHLRSSTKHKRLGNLKCPLPECRTKASIRSDNLGPHLLNFHKMSSLPERQNIIQDSRLSAMRVDSNRKIRRRSSRG